MATNAKWPNVSIDIVAETGKPRLTWEAVPGAVAYEIYRASTKDGHYTHMWTLTKTTYSNSTAVPGKTYYYKVKALCVEPQLSNPVYITCDCPRPKVNIDTDEATGKPVLTWAADPNAVAYEIFRAMSKTGKYEHIWSVNAPKYQNTSAEPGVTYYYKVKTLCAASRFGDSALSEPAYITCDCAAPKAAVDGGRLVWGPVRGADRFEIHRCASENGSYIRIATVEENSYEFTNVFEEDTYYKVRALHEKTAYADSAFSIPVHVEPSR